MIRKACQEGLCADQYGQVKESPALMLYACQVMPILVERKFLLEKIYPKGVG